ncbi:phage recombination protein Bet [Streptococcus phocae subsp. salmonis]|uniref:phage recombination protein Bet n=1 Tax=Streptococcus phocae TaxID=119224 RepID=UPI0006909557|nr:phage recombination protein Bet [Streptococcus phocae]QBX27821.1 recombinational DNA repair protein [Streptococcus phage Javan420]
MSEVAEKKETFINNPQLLNSKIIREYFDPKGLASKEELAFFLALAHERNLNPFLKEVYFVKFNGSPAQTIVSKDVFMKIAESHQEYDGFEAGVVVETKEGELVERKGALLGTKDTLIGGWCKVYRKDRSRPIEVQISVKEFGKNQSTWKTMPANMIRKTAIVNALREAFPGTLRNMFTEDDTLLSRETKDVTPPETNSLDDLIDTQNENKDVSRNLKDVTDDLHSEPEKTLTDENKGVSEDTTYPADEIPDFDKETGEITASEGNLFDNLGDLI